MCQTWQKETEKLKVYHGIEISVLITKDDKYFVISTSWWHCTFNIICSSFLLIIGQYITCLLDCYHSQFTC